MMQDHYKVYRSISVLATALAVKNEAGTIRGWWISNAAAAAAAFVKIYDVPAADVDAASTVPILTLRLPAASAANLADANIRCKRGISIRAVTGVADNDTTAVGANEVIANVFYS